MARTLRFRQRWLVGTILLSLVTAVAIVFLWWDDGQGAGGDRELANSSDQHHLRKFYRQPGILEGLEERRGDELALLPKPGPSEPPQSAEKRSAWILPSQLLADVYFNLEGNREFSDEMIIASLEIPEKITGHFLKSLVREQITDFYRSQGQTGMAIETISIEGVDPTFVDVVIREGETFQLGRVEFEGLTKVSQEEVRKFYPPAGQVFDWPLLQEADRQLARYFRDLGFLDVQVHSQADRQSRTQVLDHRVFLTEGSQYRVASLSVPPELVGSIPFQQGDVFRPSLLENFLNSSGIPPEELEVNKDPVHSAVDVTLY